MEYKKIKKTVVKKPITTCKHDYVNTNGIISCKKCDSMAIQYLTPLERPTL